MCIEPPDEVRRSRRQCFHNRRDIRMREPIAKKEARPGPMNQQSSFKAKDGTSKGRNRPARIGKIATPAKPTSEVARPTQAFWALNSQIAAKLRQAASILSRQGANPFRVSAYQQAGETVSALKYDIGALYSREGMEGLERIPSVGRSIGAAIAQMIRTGRWPFLEQLRGTLDPEQLFQAIPGIGPKLARLFHATLGVETLEELEAAAHEGRLAAIPGVGERRAELVRMALAQMLARTRPPRGAAREEPSVELLLDVDREYRDKAATGELPNIAPKRFNPNKEAWLPILHTERDKWHLTAMFSNTARAHELRRTKDWVVVYFSCDHGDEGQRTVVTETRGEMVGQRVVRGREAECRAHYGLSEAIA